MWVEITQGALTPGVEDDLALLGVLALCWAGRHQLLGDRAALTAWASGIGIAGTDLSDVVDVLLDRGQQVQALGPSQELLQVVGAQAQWTAPLALRPAAALGLLARPLRLWLENGRNDWSFLLAFASPAQARLLEGAARAGWLVVSSGGGCGELKVLVEDLATGLGAKLSSGAELGEERRFFVVLDSDRTVPGPLPSSQQAVERGLRAAEGTLSQPQGWAGQVLQRREAENYIPTDALESWAMTFTGDDRTQIKRLARALRQQGTPLLDHYDYKKGMAAAVLQPLLSAAPTDDQSRALHLGLGAERGLKFYQQHHAALTDPSGELGPLLARVLERL
ncbi:MAG: hypothetical protein JNM72_27130 [Deltaproteobacteria bacterium]|nr:hypothetical protein [Deltaproteobacteria bacterium]